MQETQPIPLRPPRRQPGGASAGPWRARPKVKKLRVALILAGLGVLALISTIFGMMMAVAGELPSLETRAQLRAAVNSTLYAADGHQLAKLTGRENRIIDSDDQISPYIRNAVIAVEDRRFYEHQGVDLRGMARAFWSDVVQQHAAQGASTITEQFVKNALAAQRNRTVLQKLREAALAYHLERRWSKQKILNQYLNTVYFGNGAYGVESAVRTYFGGRGRHYGQNEHVAQNVSPDQAALLAGMIASPAAYNPVTQPVHSRERRDLVLRDMLDQGKLTRAEYTTAVHQAIPAPDQIAPPHPDSEQPYFTDWVAQQAVDRYGSARVFGGGLKISTTLDPALQSAGEQAIQGRVGGVGPAGALVAIDNRTGAVKAIVGGDDYARRPFNIATDGHRQPGSAIKPFILATALQRGISPDSVWASHAEVFHLRGGGTFVVKNFQNAYAGETTLADATAHSDNSVFAALGLQIGTRPIAEMAQQMGIRTPLSTNPAMLLGGLRVGVTPLEMAYAYSTIANRGRRVSGSLASYPLGPVTMSRVQDGGHVDQNQVVSQRVFSTSVGDQLRTLLRGVVLNGTGISAQVDEWSAGKTGTTENYGDAWFVGFTDKLTVAVWVGYPDRVISMAHLYKGGPVEGGTYPAEIWHDFMTQAIQLDRQRHPNQARSTAGPAPALGGSPRALTPLPQTSTGPARATAPPRSGGTSAPATPQRKAPAARPSAPTNAAPATPHTQAPPAQTSHTAPPAGGGQTNGGGGGATGGTSGGVGPGAGGR